MEWYMECKKIHGFNIHQHATHSSTFPRDHNSKHKKRHFYCSALQPSTKHSLTADVLGWVKQPMSDMRNHTVALLQYLNVTNRGLQKSCTTLPCVPLRRLISETVLWSLWCHGWFLQFPFKISFHSLNEVSWLWFWQLHKIKPTYPQFLCEVLWL